MSSSIMEDTSLSTGSYLLKFVTHNIIYVFPSPDPALKTNASNSSKNKRGEVNRCIALVFRLQYKS